jgi:hypothetical protein
VEKEAGTSLTAGPLRIDEAILHFLAGVPAMDVHLHSYVKRVGSAHALPGSQSRCVSDIVRVE